MHLQSFEFGRRWSYLLSPAVVLLVFLGCFEPEKILIQEGAPSSKPGGGESPLLVAAEKARLDARPMDESDSLSLYVRNILLSSESGWAQTESQRKRLKELAQVIFFDRKNGAAFNLIDPKPLSKIVKNLALQSPRIVVGVGLLAKMNALADPNKIPGDRKLRTPKESMEIHVYKRSCALEVCVGTKQIVSWPIGIGKPDSPTPEGIFEVSDVVKLDQLEREATLWIRPEDGKKLYFGDAEYPFGTRFMRFSPPFEHFGIHGTDTNDAIGTNRSHGCVRMKCDESRALAELVDTLGAAKIPVEIH